MNISNKFNLSDIVYLKTDIEQYERMVTKISICADNTLLYQLVCGTEYSEHYEAELSKEMNVLTKLK